MMAPPKQTQRIGGRFGHAFLLLFCAALASSANSQGSSDASTEAKPAELYRSLEERNSQEDSDDSAEDESEDTDDSAEDESEDTDDSAEDESEDTDESEDEDSDASTEDEPEDANESAENESEDANESAENESAELYRSPQERREAGLGTELTEWLSFSGLAEIGAEHQNNRFQENISNTRSHDTWQSVQLGFDVTFSDLINAELLFEYDDENQWELDTGVLNFEAETWSISAGRQYVPFGQYYSHFVTDPMLIFGETRDTALTLNYSYGDVVKLSTFVFDGHAKRAEVNGDTLDWGISIEFTSEDETLTIGASYLSDLAETSESFLEDFDNVYEDRVAGWNAYALVNMDKFEITAEIVKAYDYFAELDAGADAPLAWNVELAYFPWPSFELAVRTEASNELIDRPKLQYGVSATWRIQKQVTLAADYLFGRFKDEFVYDDDDNELDSRHLVAAQLSIEF